MSTPISKALVAGAIDLLRAIEETGNINESLLSWIDVVNHLGYAKACEKYPKLAGKFTDSMVIEALEVIARSEDKWPSRPEKLQAAGRILTNRMTKAEIRSIALQSLKQS